MNILHIVQRYWPAGGGAETHMGEISAHLAAQGHAVTVATTDARDFELFWTPGRRRVPEPEGEHEGVRILRFPVRHVPLSPLAYPAIRRLLWLLSWVRPVPVSVLARLARVTPWVPGLWRWLATTDAAFDLVAGMTICFEPLLAAGLRFARRRGVPFVAYPLTHLGAGPAPAEDALSRFYTMRHQVALVTQSDALVAQTPAERDFYCARGLPAERAVVAGPGVHPDAIVGGDGVRFRERHSIPEAVTLVVSLASMSYDKGTVHLVEAVRRLWREGRSVELALAGTVLSPFRRFLGRLPKADRARLRVLGRVSEAEKRDLLAAADVFAMPSRTDSFGIVYLEAWLYRTPVVGARTWGVRDVIADGEDGLLVPFGDVPALAGALTTLIDAPDLRAAMGARGERKVRARYTWDVKHALVHRLYRRLQAGP